MATSSGSNKLMDEINDQFLVCKICYEFYKSPKTLTCLHTFCTDCLEKHQDAEMERSYRYMLYTRSVTCPICRKRTDLPTGGIKRLPDNFLVANLSDVINRRKPTHKVPQCEICKTSSGVTATAISKCLDCSKLLCRNCVELHRRTKVTQSHGLFDIEVEKDIICKFHPEEVVRFYCEPCEVCVCVLCTFQEHKGHDVSSFTEGIEKYRHSLDSLLVVCRGRISLLKDELHIISKCEHDIKHTEEQITDMAIESIATIRRKEREMVRDLYLAYGEDTLEFIKEKDFIQESMDSLQSTCNLTDIILKDKSIELLLLKKEIQEKLNILLQRKWQGPPPAALQEVRFISGQPTFGSIQVGSVPPGKDKNDNAANEKITWQSIKIQAVTANTQTERAAAQDAATTMGKLAQGYNNEQLTQTDIVIRKEMGTATMPEARDKPIMKTQFTLAMPDVRDGQTMTICTPTMKRKIQTESTVQTNQETIRSPIAIVSATVSKSSNTPTHQMTERATMTKIRKLNDQTTATLDLVATNNNETNTEIVVMQCSATETINNAVHNKGTLTTRPSTSDKITATNKLIQLTQETNTPQVLHDDVSVQAKMYGKDACVATKTIVTVHAATGEANVSSADVGVDTPWKIVARPTEDNHTSYDFCGRDQGSMTAVPKCENQGTYTNYFNMVDNSVAMDEPLTNSVETSTDMYDLKDALTNTDLLQNEHVNVDGAGTSKNVETLDEICQTMISLIDVMLWPSMMPVNRETSTDSVILSDQATAMDQTNVTDASMNTAARSMCDTAVGDSCCTTIDIECNTTSPTVDTAEMSMCTDAPALREQWCHTDEIVMTDSSVATDIPSQKDSSHDVFKGYLNDVQTNTDPVVVRPFVENCEMSTNTITSILVDAGSLAKADMQDNECETLPLPSHSRTSTREGGTTMNSVSEVKDTFICTMQLEVNSVGSGTNQVHTTECGSETEKLSTLSKSIATNTIPHDSKCTETNNISTNEFGMMTKVDVMDAGVITSQHDVKHQHTAMDPPFQNEVGVETTPVQSASKGTHTEPKDSKSVGSYTYVQNVEKATYMPQPVTVTAGTSTPTLILLDKSAATEMVDLCEMSTNTQAVRTAQRETSMNSGVFVKNAITGTADIEMVDCPNDPIVPRMETRGINTKLIEQKDSETSTKEIMLLTAGTTTNHRISYSDVITETMSMDTLDQGTSMTQAKLCDKGMVTKPESKSIGILKKPHTITRGAGTINVKLRNSSTSPDAISSSECGTMTTNVVTTEQGINVKPFGLISRSSSTPLTKVVEVSTTMPQIILTDRGNSPVESTLVDRASSPIEFPIHERQTSPIPMATTESVHTSTVHIDVASCSTGMPHIEYTERSSSPILDLLEKATLHRGTSMPHMTMTDEEMVAHPEVSEKGIGTHTVNYISRASTPIRHITADQGTNVAVEMITKGASTPHITREDKSTSIRQPGTVNSSTEMQQVNFVEKETCTPFVHMMHKNVATENMHMTDKQTNTADVTAAYRDLVAPPKPFTVTRGTSMAHTSTASKETSPPRFDVHVERGSSPIKNIMVDKGILVTKGEILEPVDTYHSAGGKNKPLRPIADKKMSQLACITEDGESSQDEEVTVAESKPLPPMRRITSPRSMRTVPGMTHKERFWPSTPRMGKNAVSAFSVEGRASTASILCRVETGTNTKEVELQTQGTSTPTVGMEDKAVCTEAMPVENKMAECISKLKTVRQRLEQNQDGVYVQASGSQHNQLLEPSKYKPHHSPLMTVTMRSKSFSDKLNENTTGPIYSPTARKSPTFDRSSSSDESDSSLSKAKARLARKQRLDITQLLRTSSLPEQENPPRPMLPPKPKIQTVMAHVIPKLNIDDFRSKSVKEKPDGHKGKKARLRPSITLTTSDMPPRVPTHRGNVTNNEKQKERVDGEDSRRHGVRKTPPPPDPPARSASLRHALLAAKGLHNEHGSTFRQKKESSPTKR